MLQIMRKRVCSSHHHGVMETNGMSKKRVIKIDKSDLHKIERYGCSTFSNVVIQLVPEKDKPCIEVHGGVIE